MRDRGIHLQYSFEARGQHGAEIENPLFDLLAALHDHGSIHHAARALGASYRHVWGELKRWEGVLGEALVTWNKGRPSQLTAFAQRLLWAERQARTRMTPHLEALRAELEHVLAQALDGSQQVLDVFASHDLALPALREYAAARSLHVSLRFAGSVDALRALAAGRCTVAGFHVPALQQASPVFSHALKPLLRPGVHKLIGCWRRRQGLMVRPPRLPSLCGLADLTASDLRFVNRQAGSGTRLLMDHLLQQAGLSAQQIRGYSEAAEDSHVAVAAAIAGGAADVGPGVEAAAREFGLDFIPLVEEDYYLVCLRDALETDPLRSLREMLASPAWLTQLQTLPGHAPARPGEVLSLTKALPWWHYRVPKRAAGSAASPARS